MFLQEILGHEADIMELDILPNGNLVSASKDTTLKIWNRDTYSHILTLSGHTDSVQSMIVVDDGNIVSVSNDRTIRVWNFETGELVRTIKQAHNGWVTCIKKHIYQDEIVTGSRDETIKIWNYKTGELKSTIRGYIKFLKFFLLSLKKLNESIILDFRSFDGCNIINNIPVIFFSILLY